MYEPKELIERVTGAKPTGAYFMRYIVDKYTEIYGLDS
jgi:Zn-dependent M32 family carboxypeptidase